jgi:hypothetical protein
MLRLSNSMKFLLLLILTLIYIDSSAQEKGKIRFGGDISVNFLHNTDLPLFQSIIRNNSFSLNYNLTNNTNIGLKYFMFDDYIKYQEISNPAYFNAKTILIDYNYYIYPNNIFIELGIGYIHIPANNQEIDSHTGTSSYSFTTLSVSDYNNVIGLIGIGCEASHIRLSLSYLICPLPMETTYRKIDGSRGYRIGDYTTGFTEVPGTTYTTVNNFDHYVNRLSLNLGFYIGGGSWKKPQK